MDYLIQGNEPKQRIALLLSLTKISSEPIQDALHDHLCESRGFEIDKAAALNGVSQSNLSRALKQLNKVAGVVEDIKEIDWQRFGYKVSQ